MILFVSSAASGHANTNIPPELLFSPDNSKHRLIGLILSVPDHSFAIVHNGVGWSFCNDDEIIALPTKDFDYLTTHCEVLVLVYKKSVFNAQI